MMRMTVLGSGSKGNSTVIASSKTQILVDAGLSCRELLKRMAVAGEDPGQLDAILITHEHQDHVNGLGVLGRKLGIPVFFTEATHRAWVRMLTPRTTMSYAQWLDQRRQQQEAAEAGAGPASPGIDIETLCAEAEEELAAETATPAKPSIRDNPSYLPALEFFRPGTNFLIGDIDVTPFTIPHDAADPCGFVFEAEGVRMALATDLGYMPPNVKQAIRNCDVLMLESNHDLEMLRDGPYPWSVKQRVLSRVGHLSNVAAADFLANDYDGGAAFVVLAHLSESNNMPELARVAAEEAIGNRMRLLGNKILLAQQSGPMEPICL
ncbi:MAG: MBL fold metallo-hydrolase [Acidobacteriota bacterium]|nr:MBL fold metallo-hydrolase [Acidobacteriota bacterium]